MRYLENLKAYLDILVKSSPIDLKVYLGTLATFTSYTISIVSMDVMKDIITISVGVSTLLLTFYKLGKDIAKDIKNWVQKKKLKKS